MVLAARQLAGEDAVLVLQDAPAFELVEQPHAGETPVGSRGHAHELEKPVEVQFRGQRETDLEHGPLLVAGARQGSDHAVRAAGDEAELVPGDDGHAGREIAPGHGIQAPELQLHHVPEVLPVRR